MIPGIRQVNWDVLPASFHIPDLLGCERVLALWPAPQPECACLKEAGFTDFQEEDDTEEWDKQWREVLVRVLATLETVGGLRVRGEVEVFQRYQPGFWRRLLGALGFLDWPKRRVHLPVVDQIVVTTGDDRFGSALLEWGDPPRAFLLAGDGHAILWIGLTCDSPLTPELLTTAAAGGLPIARTTMSWEKLTGRA
ncbi:MAG: hypothetical protein NT031_06035, partial [Planctomycetota bacterium]|nr:hypothetical protein [Planctomycetota bacterium]